MKLLLKFLKMLGITLLGILLLVVIVGFLFINLSPQFGGKPTAKMKELYAKSENYKEGKFFNQIPTPMDMGFGAVWEIAGEYLKSNTKRKPPKSLQVEKIDSLDIVDKVDTITRLTWFGHSAFLLEIEGKNVLIDPMLGQSPSPHPAIGTKRYSQELPIAIEKLPYIDAVIISHDHYDHLDYGSIMKLKEKVGEFYMPLGVGAHLISWGVAEAKIHELNWWEEIVHDGLTFRCTPSRHFSGRGLGDRFNTLWCSWIINSASQNIYFSGDSGYGPHFKEIGEKYGPFDFAMMECGQYNEHWANIHMMPEETVQAFIDVKGKLLMPIHWGAFTLSLHDWTDPVERALSKAAMLDVPITTPKIGEPIVFGQKEVFDSRWWEDYNL